MVMFFTLLPGTLMKPGKRVTGPYATPSIILDFGNAGGMKVAKPPKEIQDKPAPSSTKTSKPVKK